jgi:hypothetical protein
MSLGNSLAAFNLAYARLHGTALLIRPDEVFISLRPCLTLWERDLYLGALLIFVPETGPNTPEFVPSPTGGRARERVLFPARAPSPAPAGLPLPHVGEGKSSVLKSYKYSGMTVKDSSAFAIDWQWRLFFIWNANSANRLEIVDHR